MNINIWDLGLGGRPLNKKVLNSEGKIIREFIEQENCYQKGIEELLSLIVNNKKRLYRAVRKDPHHCHRGYIVTNTLLGKRCASFISEEMEE